MTAQTEERIIRNDIEDIVSNDPEVKKNAELMDIFRIAYERRNSGKPMREVALALDKSLAGYITSHEEVPDSILSLHRKMLDMAEI